MFILGQNIITSYSKSLLTSITKAGTVLDVHELNPFCLCILLHTCKLHPNSHIELCRDGPMLQSSYCKKTIIRPRGKKKNQKNHTHVISLSPKNNFSLSFYSISSKSLSLLHVHTVPILRTITLWTASTKLPGNFSITEKRNQRTFSMNRQSEWFSVPQMQIKNIRAL